MKTCVLCLSRRNALECTIRSRSRWNGVRSGESSSATARRAGYERAASGDSWVRSNASMRSWKERSARVVWETVTEGFSQADRRRDGPRGGGSAVAGPPPPLFLGRPPVLERGDPEPEAEPDVGFGLWLGITTLKDRRAAQEEGGGGPRHGRPAPPRAIAPPVRLGESLRDRLPDNARRALLPRAHGRVRAHPAVAAGRALVP